MANLQWRKGSDAMKLHVLAENFLYFIHKVYKGKFCVQNLTKLRTNGQIYRQIKSVNSNLFLHFKIIPFKNLLYIAHLV